MKSLWNRTWQLWAILAALAILSCFASCRSSQAPVKRPARPLDMSPHRPQNYRKI